MASHTCCVAGGGCGLRAECVGVGCSELSAWRCGSLYVHHDYMSVYVLCWTQGSSVNRAVVPLALPPAAQHIPKALGPLIGV